jgi:hypothetical protein
MAIIGTAIRFLALFVMYRISNPKIMPLLPPEKVAQVEMAPVKAVNVAAPAEFNVK